MSASTPDTIETSHVLAKGFIETSATTLGLYFRLSEDPEIRHVNFKVPVGFDWEVSSIVIAGPSDTIIFTCAFDPNQLIRHIEKIISEVPEENNFIRGFVKEYCNQVAGPVKAKLSKVGMETGLSLAFASKGYATEWFQPRSEESVYKNWILEFNNSSLYCSLEIDIASTFTEDDFNTKYDENELGAITFL
tara:strand:- start:451 stop:1023 length:573 start_codon:yes stop_codon:yes gene_type:complete